MNGEQSRPGLDILADYLEGLLSEEERLEVERAVAEDPPTAALLAELEALPALLASDEPEPMPAKVTARIDASLAAERVGTGASSAAAVVTSLPVRRRRWLAPALVAAAAAGAIGIGAQVVDRIDEDPVVSADADADALDQAEAAAGPEEGPESAWGRGTPRRLVSLRKDNFASDVMRALDSPLSSHYLAAAARTQSAGAYSIVADDCAVELAPGKVLPIRLDGKRAVLVLRRIAGQRDSREALAYPAQCPARSPEGAGDLSLPLVRATIELP